MTANLQTLCLNSLGDFETIFVSPPKSTRLYEHSGFILRLILPDTEIKYEPSFQDFEISFLNMIDIVVKACSNIPRVETRLYSDSAIQQQNGLKKDVIGGLVPVILPNIQQQHKDHIAKVVQRESQGPIAHSRNYDKYAALINKKAEEELERFLNEEHTFAECEREVKRYQRLVKEITYNTEKVVRIGMFEVHCEELIKTLARRAENILNKLLERMLNEHFEINRQLCEEFEQIAEKCLTTPANTAHLMELKKAVQKAETETVFELEKKLFQARIRLEFLLDNSNLSPAQIRSNNQTFSWNDRLPNVFEEHRNIVAEKTIQFQEALKVCVLLEFFIFCLGLINH
jgi:dynein heavy chain